MAYGRENQRLGRLALTIRERRRADFPIILEFATVV
jgi:hypothetical protein